MTTLSLRFIKNELLPVRIVKSFKILLTRRSDADYGDFAVIDREDAEDSVVKAEEILDQIDVLRKRLADEL